MGGDGVGMRWSPESESEAIRGKTSPKRDESNGSVKAEADVEIKKKGLCQIGWFWTTSAYRFFAYGPRLLKVAGAFVLGRRRARCRDYSPKCILVGLSIVTSAMRSV